MNEWTSYPESYRQKEVKQILNAARAGESVSVIGLSGAGKSNLMGFLAHRADWQGHVALVDCNRLRESTPESLFTLICQSLGSSAIPGEAFPSLESAVENQLQRNPAGLCILLDRFDRFSTQQIETIAGNLRALRDRFKYRLAYVTATRRPLPHHTELAELTFANTMWLGPLRESDILWNIARYANRKQVSWDESDQKKIRDLSGGYPSILRALCEAYAAGCPLEPDALRSHPVVQRRVAEFQEDQPTPEMLRLSGLQANLFLGKNVPAHPKSVPIHLTASESRLYEALQAHAGEVCPKDVLIAAVWPEDKVFEEGIRDDSLAQLVRRLRKKIERDPKNPQIIQTIPGRGYLFNPLTD